MKKQLFIIVLTILCGAYASAAQSKDVRFLIEQNEIKFAAAFAEGDTEPVSHLYTADAQILPPNGALVEGRANIRNFWQGAWDAGVKKVETRTSEVAGQGDFVYEIGAYTFSGAKREILDEGKYLVVWKREGRNWLMHRDIRNSSRSSK